MPKFINDKLEKALAKIKEDNANYYKYHEKFIRNFREWLNDEIKDYTLSMNLAKKKNMFLEAHAGQITVETFKYIKNELSKIIINKK